MTHEELTLQINGAKRTGAFPRGTRLLDAIRRLGFTGTKEGCGEGECGACSVVIDGKVVNSCLVYAKQAVGQKITTVEALGVRDVGLAPQGRCSWAVDEPTRRRLSGERAMIEGGIGAVKSSRYNFHRPRARSVRMMGSSGQLAVLGFNLNKLARAFAARRQAVLVG